MCTRVRIRVCFLRARVASAATGASAGSPFFLSSFLLSPPLSRALFVIRGIAVCVCVCVCTRTYDADCVPYARGFAFSLPLSADVGVVSRDAFLSLLNLIYRFFAASCSLARSLPWYARTFFRRAEFLQFSESFRF